ncbi:MAG: 3-hydroxyacyl-CoA dehydrogenase [Sphingomonadales bacterium]
MPEIKTIGIVGSGAMGRGIAQIAAVAGIDVRLWDGNPDAPVEASAFVARMLRRQADKGRIKASAAEAAIGRITIAGALSDLAAADAVVEAIIEDIDIKRTLFAELDAIVADDCILASNTSSLPVTALASAVRNPGRVAGFHFFNPVPLMKVVEVIATPMTGDTVIADLCALAERIGHRPVRAADSPGFLVNHAGRGLSTEGLRIVTEAIATPQQVDDVMREGAGFRMGPFELFDLTGLDVSFPVMESIYNQFYQEPRFRPAPLARLRHTAGLLGRKTGRGFYRYDDGRKIVASEKPVPKAEAMPVWLGEAPTEVHDLIRDLGAVIDHGATPLPESLCLVAPVGVDATTTAHCLGLDPARTVAVDPLFGLDGRRTLMTTPVTDAIFRDAAHALLASDSKPVTVIHDSPGFIAQRVVAAIVNIGCDIAQQRIATPADIDAAVKLGLGYPKGPLGLGDAVGAGRITEILEAMHAFYGDARYRPSPWLKRRALLGVSLTTPEG